MGFNYLATKASSCQRHAACDATHAVEILQSRATMLANRMHELPITPILRSGESTNRAQSLKEYSESNDTDSFIRSLDALTLQAATSITPSAIV
jgi:hypothetical protein